MSPQNEGADQLIVSARGRAGGVLFVAEAEGPGTDGDLFRAPGGELLADIITKGMGLAIDDVQVAAVIPGTAQGADQPVSPAVQKQIEAMGPQVIVTLGRPAAAAVLGVDAPLPRLRGQVQTTPSGVQTVATYHPAYLMRAPQHKKDAWQDIQLAMQVAGIQRPG